MAPRPALLEEIILKIRHFLVVFALVVAAPAQSQLVDPVINDNEFSATIELAGVSAELSIRFEKAIGLSLENLGVSVHAIDPLDLDLISRLPSSLTGPLATLPSGFPVMVRVEPPTDGGLSFEGVVNVELYTRNLQYTIGTPLRIFTAPTGTGTFRDVTEHVSGGSYRTRSGGTHFSDFLILVDTRSTETVVAEKFDRLFDALDDYQHDLPTSLYAQVLGHADQALAAWGTGNAASAIGHIDALHDAVLAAALAGQVPRVWRSARDLENIDGAIRAPARTLRFSLTQAANLL
jgi:hypothetical protein